jgi:hypothetical protein
MTSRVRLTRTGVANMTARQAADAWDIIAPWLAVGAEDDLDVRETEPLTLDHLRAMSAAEIALLDVDEVDRVLEHGDRL